MNQIRQAIVTKYIPPTNYFGSRVKASAFAMKKTYDWIDALDVEANHSLAAKKLAQELKWLTPGVKLIGGSMPDGSGNCYILWKPNAKNF